MQHKFISLFVTIAAALPVLAAPIVDLGSASSFGMLGGTISNTGTSLVTGNIGVISAAGTITGFNPTGTTVGGSVIAPGSAASNDAYQDFVTAFDAAMLLASTQSYSDLTVDRTFLGNNVYTFGIPNISTTTGINLTFDAQNDPNAVFILRTDGAFTANGDLNFALQNQAQAKNIFWIVGTIGAISPASSAPVTFEGNILAGESFTMSAAAGGSGVLAGTINGCVFAQTSNTLAGTTNISGCSASMAAVPEPSSAGLLGLGCVFGVFTWMRARRASRTAQRHGAI